MKEKTVIKRCLALLLAFAMVISGLTIPEGKATVAEAAEETTSATNIEGANAENAVAKIGDAYFTTFELAYEAAEAGDTIELLADITIGSQFEIAKAITIDGNMHKVTTNVKDAFKVSKVNVEFKNMNIEHTATNAAILIWGAANVSMTDIVISANSISYENGLIMLRGTAKINLTLKNVDVTMDVTTANTTDNIHAILRVGNWNEVNDVVVNVEDCNFNAGTSDYVRCVLVMNKSKAEVNITNSTLTSKNMYPILDRCTTGTTTITKSNVKIGTTDFVACIGDTNLFKTFDDALAAVQAGDTIELLSDNIIISSTVTIDKVITIDGNMHEVTTNVANAIKVSGTGNDAYVEFKNMAIKHTASQAAIIIWGKANVSLTDVDIKAELSSNYENGLIILRGTNKINLNLKNVEINMDVTTANTTDNIHAILRVGNWNEVNDVVVNVEDCNFNAGTSDYVRCVLVMNKSKAEVNITNSALTSKNLYPILDRCTTATTTITTLNSTMNMADAVAQIGEKQYMDFPSALTDANASEDAVTIEVLKDIEISSIAFINNTNGKDITIDGNNHKVTTSTVNNTIRVQYAGNVEFKDMTIIHTALQCTIRIEAAANVSMTNVDIECSADNYQYGLISTLTETGEDEKIVLTLTDVDVTMNTTLAEDNTSNPSVIRTGNNNQDKTVDIILTDCEWNLTGASGVRGILGMNDTTANITMTNTTIHTADVEAIKATASTAQKVVMDNACELISDNSTTISGYDAQVENTVYRLFDDARIAANEATESVTITLLNDIRVTQNVYVGNENGKSITFDGNNKNITTAGGSNNHAFRVNKNGAVTFKNMTVYHKNMGSFVQVEKDLEEVTLSLVDVTIDATNPANTSVDETTGNYNYALINISSPATINLTNVNVDMDVTVAGRDYPGIVRTGNHGDVEKEITINVKGGNWDTTGATGRHGIVIMKSTSAKVNLYGVSITTADAAPIADYSQKAVITRDDATRTTCTGNYVAYVLGIASTSTHTVYETFEEALAEANGFTGSATVGLLKDVTVGAANIGNAKGKLLVDGNGYTITTENGNNTFTVNQNKEVEFRNLTIKHKRYGSVIQVNSEGAILTISNVFIDATYPPEVKQTDETYINTYNYALINLLKSCELNMTNSQVIMEVEEFGANGGKQSSIIRTGNDDKDANVYKEITINLTDCTLDTTKAKNRSGILVVDAKVEINLKGNTKIYTQASMEGDEDGCAPVRGLLGNGTRVGKISMEDACEIKSGTSTAYADVVLHIEGGITDACVWTYKKYDNLTAFRTEAGLKVPSAVPTGYIFAGWYTDKSCTAEFALSSDDITTTSAYAKFVPEHVLGVKAQVPTYLKDGVQEGEVGHIRFVTTVDSLDYLEIGFDYTITLGGVPLKEGTAGNKNNTVYRKLYAIGTKDGEVMNLVPEYTFCAVSQYFKAVTVTNIPESAFGAEITVTPFWRTIDGTKVYGESVTKTVQQGIDSMNGDGLSNGSETTESVYTNRVVMVSDLHYTTSLDKETYDDENWSFSAWIKNKLPNASWAAGNAFGYTQEQKLQEALKDIQGFGATNGIDAVMILGDLTLDDYGYRNLVDNYLDDFKANFMDQLGYTSYAIAGNHDSYTNSEWKNTMGTDRQYSVVIGDAVFVMLDTFAAEHATGANGSSYVGVDIDFLRGELQKPEYANKTIFLCSHYYQEGKLPENDAALNALIKGDSRVVCMFRAHTHKNTAAMPATLAGSPLVDVGGYAYNGQKEDDGSYDFNTFDKSWAWGYQVVEWNDSEVHIYHVKPARTYTDNNGIVHNYKGAIEGDFVIKLK